MRRRVSNALVGLSVLACIAAAVFWVRSLRFDPSKTGESVTFRRTDPRWWVISRRGTLTLCRQNGRDWGKEFGKVEGLGFRFGGRRGPSGSLWNLAVPYWFITAATAAPPVIWAVRRRRRRSWSGRGFCRECGYDMRATPGRCPECGSEPRRP